MSAMLQNAISPKIYTFGFGADLDDDMLNAISEEGNGQSTYMEDAESIPSSFASALGGLMSMAAQNLELHFVPKVRTAVTFASLPWLGLLLAHNELHLLCVRNLSK